MTEWRPISEHGFNDSDGPRVLVWAGNVFPLSRHVWIAFKTCGMWFVAVQGEQPASRLWFEPEMFAAIEEPQS